MRLRFVRSGGFAGILLTANLDPENLAPDEMAALEREVAEASFFDLPDQVGHPPSIPDGFEYEITVSSSTQVRTLKVSETLVTDTLRPLVDHLTNLARTGKYR